MYKFEGSTFSFRRNRLRRKETLEYIKSEITEGSKDGSQSRLFNVVVVFAHASVFDVMESIFNVPMLPDGVH